MRVPDPTSASPEPAPVSPSPSGPGAIPFWRCRAVFVALASLVGLALLLNVYLKSVQHVWTLNPMFHADAGKAYDQPFYMEHAREYATGETGLSMARSRMPLYPWMLAFFYDKSLDETQLLNRYIRFNVALSVISLIVVGLIFARCLSIGWAWWLIAVTAIHVFLYKAVLVQPEISFYLGFFTTFVAMLAALSRPLGSRLGMFALGLGVGMTYLLKGSALPTLGLFVGLYVLRALYLGMAESRGSSLSTVPRRSRAEGFLLIGLFMLGFLNIAGSYMLDSKRWYGSPFYDPNSRYYLWAESPEEMGVMQRTGLASGKPMLTPSFLADPDSLSFLKKWVPDDARRQKLVDLTNAQGRVMLEGEWDILPGFPNYRQSHTLAQAIQRLKEGVYEVLDHNHDHPDGYGKFVTALVLIATGLGVWRFVTMSRSERRVAVQRYGFAAALAVCSIGGNIVLYGWWAAVSNRNRFFLTQYLPIVFCCGWLICRCAPHTSGKWHLGMVPVQLPRFARCLSLSCLLLAALWFWFLWDYHSFRLVHLKQ